MSSRGLYVTKARRHTKRTKSVFLKTCVVIFVLFFVPSRYAGLRDGYAAGESAREIVEEVQKRTDVKSQRYEGLLQVFDSKGKVSDKRWMFDRIGAHGNSKAVLRFIAPAEVKGVA